jgi:hypothetical protein
MCGVVNIRTAIGDVGVAALRIKCGDKVVLIVFHIATIYYDLPRGSASAVI